MITLSQVEQIHKILIDQFGGSHGVRDYGTLLSALSRPYQTFDGKDLYPTAIQKAAALITFPQESPTSFLEANEFLMDSSNSLHQPVRFSNLL